MVSSHKSTQGLIFVVDCADRDRIDEARQELHRIINDREMRDAIILIFANKQDLPDAMKPHEIQEKLGLTRIRDRNCYELRSRRCQPPPALHGDDFDAIYHKFAASVLVGLVI
ncbi:jg13168 [Pararge aegeria aegeria]|uniref:Jg13168 protein n=1 Tax=Pararge aegeria aegeria TaxID=348720 RepID=A0A8S4RRU9_9NEOP|nr:jg13168 [Pararge aegeria aegeria]